MKKLFVLFIFLIIIGTVCFVVYREGSLPVDRSNTAKKIFVVRQGDTLNEITNNLEKQDLIRSKLVFYIVVKQLNVDRSIQAGAFALSQSMDAATIANALTHGTLDKWVTILEGWRKEEVAATIAENFDIKESDFIKSAKEGYLFPDTYLIPTEAKSERVLQILQDNFDKKFDADLKAKIKKNGLTEKQAVILASLIEREARSATAKKEVAGILLKRLQNDWLLNIDATVQYAVGYQKEEKSWWKRHLSTDDLKMESPYNTYLHTGLPPAPICNPGLDSLKAVAEADASTPYWFYITGNDNKMHYAETLEEHNANVEKYLR